MKCTSFYHKLSGKLYPFHVGTSDESAIPFMTPIDHLPIDGWHSSETVRVDVSTITVIPI